MAKLKTFYLTPLLLIFYLPNVFADASIGVIKTLTGSASIQRDSEIINAKLGDELYAQDEVTTADKSSVGMLMHDDARVSMGPNTVMKLDQFIFDTQTHEGSADISVKHGTLSVIAGKMTEKTPGALKVKTPAAILAVRGTEFSIKVDPKP
jgi:hypothetical protein